jgi:hypothetical protein
VSLALHVNNPGTVVVRKCVFKLEGDTYVIEPVLNNLVLKNCQVYEYGMLLANFRSNMKTKNILVDNVVASAPNGSAAGYGGLFYIGDLGTEGMLVRNCNIKKLTGFPDIKYRGVQGGVNIESTNTIY